MRYVKSKTRRLTFVPLTWLALPSVSRLITLRKRQLGSGQRKTVARDESLVPHVLNPDPLRSEVTESPLKLAYFSVVISCSAILYLVDFISNILVLKLYWEEVYVEGTFEGSRPGSIGSVITPFAACLSLLIASQAVAVVVFRLNLPSKEYPVRSACLLPLVQTYRLMLALYRWSKERGQIQSIPREREETESLFAIMSALETSLQIPVQLAYIALTGIGDRQWQPSTVLVLSVVSSFLSGGYNAGMAIMYNASLKWGVVLNRIGISGGLYTVGSLLLRSISIAQVVMAAEVSGVDHRFLLLEYFSIASPIYFCVILIALAGTTKLLTWNAQLRAGIGMFYFLLGPVYPALEGYAPKLQSVKLRINALIGLLTAAFFNLLLDAGTLIVFGRINWGICRFTPERVDFPDRPYLSSTFKCPRFLVLTLFGAALSLISALTLTYHLLPSIRDALVVHLGRVFPSEPQESSAEGRRGDQEVFESGTQMDLNFLTSPTKGDVCMMNLTRCKKETSIV